MNRRVLVIAVVVAAVIGYYLVDRRAAENAPGSAASPTAGRSAASGGGVHVGSVNALPQSTPTSAVGAVPVPPGAEPIVVAEPVAPLLQKLVPAAQNGDARAACRVGLEKLRCVRIPQYEKLVRDKAANAEVEQKLAVDQQLCAGVSSYDSRDAWRYLWQAASAGNVAAMSKWLRDPGLEASDVDSKGYFEGWGLYRDNAPNMMEQAIKAGDVMSLYSAWFHAATGIGPGEGKIFPKDAYAALVYGEAAMPLLDARRRDQVALKNAQLRATLDAQKISQAAAEGATLRAQYFAAARPVSEQPDDGFLDPADCYK